MSLHGTDFESEFNVGGGLSGRAIQNQALGPLAGSAGGGLTSNSMFGDGGIFGKGGTASIALGGLQTLGTLWGAFQQNKLAKKSLKLQETAYKTNLANSTKVYNTALEDRIRARYATEGRSGQADAKIAENRL